jgi:Lar family restriction alleviation protein
MEGEAGMRKKLKPCPFCGTQMLKEIDLTHDDPYYVIQCSVCGGSMGSGKNFDHAIEKWNRRQKER